ncbi:hypothetical protein GGR58DRAFT_452819 [Xylaria digitata]|nr:hypothetical protein GGR58DRAFT_452819 [Xylaria digitata]
MHHHLLRTSLVRLGPNRRVTRLTCDRFSTSPHTLLLQWFAMGIGAHLPIPRNWYLGIARTASRDRNLGGWGFLYVTIQCLLCYSILNMWSAKFGCRAVVIMTPRIARECGRDCF